MSIVAPLTVGFVEASVSHTCGDDEFGKVRSVPGAVATGSQRWQERDREDETRSLPLSVLTSWPTPDELIL